MAPLSHTAIANDHTRLFCILVFWNITILKDRILDLFYALNIKKTETCTNLKLSNFIRKARGNKFLFYITWILASLMLIFAASSSLRAISG